MALPSSGRISLGDINVELGRSRTSTISLDAAENGGYVAINQNSPSRPSSSNPARLSEWYSYNHSAAGCNAPTITGTDRSSTSATLYITHSNCNSMEVQYSSTGGSTWTQEGNVGCVTTKYIYSLSPSTTYLFRARIVCGGTGQYSGWSNVVTVTTCAAYGSYITEFCTGCNRYIRYADGSCGSYDVDQGCTTACGGCCCSPAYGTQINWYCSGGASIGQYSDGCNGTYDAQINGCDPSCGCEGGCVGKGCFE